MSDLPLRVLVVDDQPDVVRVIVRGLSQSGHIVTPAYSGEEGLETATTTSFDVIVLDVMLPGLDGFEVARRLRDRGVTTPILMLTARDEEDDIIQGLREGADAYLAKPFRIGELEARLLALKRRVGMEANTVLRFEDIEVDRVRREVTRGGHPIELTNIEFKFLETLMLRPGRLFTRGELLHLVWGLTSDPGTGVLNVHLGNLRRKIEVKGQPRLIRTIRRRGYQLGPGEKPDA
ncbi:MAG: response regulator transcription factor [Longimicrobiales bacterium]|nr:response regulator transcription factor [Longimicrobiales bacterium]